eukprot:NODE_20_length_44879_cov_0.624654.p18 type:complete len:279 gc:universal NODE_20_length_44879_cov_0.624654:20390-19554(-)
MATFQYPSQYEHVHYLGKGSFGTVSLCEDKINHKKVAIKCINKVNCTKLSRKINLNRELYFLNQLKHENIIEIYNIFNFSTKAIIVMEYCDNFDLLTFCQKHQFYEYNSKFIFIQILHALDYLHSNQVIHRDIKPENICLNQQMKVRLIDFGFAISYKDRLESYTGSPLYCPLEVLQRECYSFPVDIWSLGCVLYVMVCQRVPYFGESNRHLIQLICYSKPILPHKTDKSLILLIRGMLSVSQGSRWSISKIKNCEWLSSDVKAKCNNELIGSKEIIL